MGLIRAAKDAVRGAKESQFLDVIEPTDMTDGIVFAKGTPKRRGSLDRQDDDTIPNGSVVHVYPNQCLILVDGGQIVDYSAVEGYYIVENSSHPSLFNGDLDNAVEDTYSRIRYGGVAPSSQYAYFVNLQEITGLKFGTQSPINYYDTFYGVELFLKAHGSYSIRVTDPLLFYREVVAKGDTKFTVDQLGEQYLSEFMEALQSAIVRLAADGERISFLMSKSALLCERVKEILTDTWKKRRGITLQSVAIMSISYDASSQALINRRNLKNMAANPGASPQKIRCDKCGYEPPEGGVVPRFCPQCGDPITVTDYPDSK